MMATAARKVISQWALHVDEPRCQLRAIDHLCQPLAQRATIN
jgi:hypothetical protein